MKHIIFLTILLLVVAVLALFIGSELIPFSEVMSALFGGNSTKVYNFIVLEIRLPRILTALLSGVSLSVAGLLMQTYFRNSLAGPSILGVTAGAGLGVATVTMSATLFGITAFASGYSIVFASVMGSISILFVILIIASRIGNGVLLLIVGIILSSFIGATVTILQYFTDADSIQKYILWTMGSTTSTTLADVGLLSFITVFGIGISIFLIKPLNSLLMGEHYAQSLGIDVKKSRFLIILSTGILTGGITAFCGPIAFIGLAVPHLVKLNVRSSNHNYLIPVTGLTGGLIMIFADTIAQVPFSEFQLPINAVTSLISAPIIIITILKHKSNNG